MVVLGIDPGPKESAVAYFNGKTVHTDMYLNETLVSMLSAGIQPAEHYACEMVQPMGFVVGKEVFETVWWIGRYYEALWAMGTGKTMALIYRSTIKAAIVGTVRSKDKDVRAALIQRLGKEATKDVVTHQWAALAVAVYHYDCLKLLGKR